MPHKNKEEATAYRKAYYKANKEKIRTKSKAYYEANKEKIAAQDKVYKKVYRKANKEKIAAQGKVYRKANKEKLAAQGKVYRKANKEKIASQGRAWREANKERLAIAYEADAERRNAQRKAFREANKEKLSARQKADRAANPEKYARWNKNYYESHKKEYNEKQRIYKKKKYRNDPIYRLKDRIGCLIREALRRKGFTKTSRTREILECSFEEFKTYIENQFKEGMNWENRGKWELDHIVPLSAGKTKEEILDLNHYSNFQPLWREENSTASKGAKLIPTLISPENKIRYAEILSRHEAL
jgi:hypothetical protein